MPVTDTRSRTLLIRFLTLDLMARFGYTQVSGPTLDESLTSWRPVLDEDAIGEAVSVWFVWQREAS